MRPLICAFFFVAVICLGQPCMGQNVEFVPSDAFFHAVLNEKLTEAIAAGNLELEYSFPDGGNFGGFQGFHKMVVHDVNDYAVESLKMLYTSLRQTNPKQIYESAGNSGKPIQIENNPFHLFVYNRNVDWNVQRIGLKLNESWNLFPKSAVDRTSSRWAPPFSANDTPVYSSFVQSYDAVCYDLKAARFFEGLKVKYPEDIAWGIAGEHVDKPVECSFHDVQFIVTENRNLESYYRQIEQAVFYSVHESKTVKYWWENGELKSATIREK